MQNNLADLNNKLFALLEDLDDDEKMQDEATYEKTVKKCNLAVSLSKQILDVAKVQVSAIKTAESCGLLNRDLPALLTTKDSEAELVQQSKLKRLPV